MNIAICNMKELRFSIGLPRWKSDKEFAASIGDARDLVLIPGSGRSPGKENGNLLQYSGLKNSKDRGATDSQSIVARIRHD